ncbi:MAG TPA: hypothetical protein VJR93_07300 [Chthoniobacterales bacterium]|nr:hypothetical protein [Chthoniobacterales bacterium]
MGGSTTAADCHKIVAMPLIKLEGCEGCGKSTQVKIQAYRELAKNEPKQVVPNDRRLSADAIEQQAWHQLVNRFPILASYQSSKISPRPS